MQSNSINAIGTPGANWNKKPPGHGTSIVSPGLVQTYSGPDAKLSLREQLYTVKNSMGGNKIQFSQANLNGGPPRGAALQSPRPIAGADNNAGPTQLSSKMGASSQETQASSQLAANKQR